MPDVVIIGGGQAGLQAAASLRQGGFAGTVKLICQEHVAPYMRPPLSKSFIKDPAAADLSFRSIEFFMENNIDLRLGDAAISIDLPARRIRQASGAKAHYDALILATGARPRLLDTGGQTFRNVLALRSVDDARAIRELLPSVQCISVIGGGFIGLEFASVASRLGKQVTVIEAADRLMARALSPWMSEWFLKLHRSNGVEVRLNSQVKGFLDAGAAVTAVDVGDDAPIPTELVIVGIGVLPNAELAVEAGLATDNGIVVDNTLVTSDPSVFAIGDCARFPSAFFGGMQRLESVQNAVDQAKHVASSIISDRQTGFATVPWFWTEQFEVKLQMAGLADGFDDLKLVGDLEAGSFSVEYLRDGRLVGVDSVNDTRSHLAARKRLMERPASSV